ncbi:acyltransferase family protein [Paenibacillus sp. F411]|uniref:acyltransferase family protein n=1 Tax=Paenibacillus sp. F411 TaxID=2820239 RepID=UPI001AAFF087|nr:acyltransferase family protein [Paenibacillus sp. F411]MBO2944792.1 acyltransferase family protein [Paenibacillus sp. F411]
MNERDLYFDNLKFWLILLVVVGHFMEPFYGESPLGTLYPWIYSFHMPLFVFVAGYFSKSITYPKYYIQLVSNLALPYLIFETLYTWFDFYTQGLEKLHFTYFYPYWILWFLFSMLLWKMLLPYLLVLKAPLWIALWSSVLLGYALDVDYYASVSRTLYFLPFFLLGVYFKREWLLLLKKPGVRLVSLLMLLSGAALLHTLSPVLEPAWFYGAMNYAQFGLDTWYAGAFRLLTYTFTLLMGAAFLSWVPQQRHWYTDRGMNTMYVFLLHGFVVKSLLYFGVLQEIGSVAGGILPILLGVLVTVLLSSRAVKASMGWLVEPNVSFLFKPRVTRRSREVRRKEEF